MRKNKPGPPAITLDYAAVEMIASMGGTNEQIAEALKISASTLKAIRRRDPKVEDAIRMGKDRADVQVVASLYNRAVAKNICPHCRKPIQGFGADTTACIFWLKNRRPVEWRDRHDLEHGGGIKLDGKLVIEVVKTK